MAELEHGRVRNSLLGALSADDFSYLRPHLEPVPLVLNTLVMTAGETIPAVAFPETGIVSMLATTSEGRIEIGLTGREGLVGIPAVLGVVTGPYNALVQGQGEALRLPVAALHEAMDASRSLRALLLRYAHVWLIQVTQTAYANASFTMEARLARWILMTHDRAEGDELLLTHEFLSAMLGVRRSGVTLAVQALEGNRLIRARRGRITVRDRPGLEALAEDAYGLAEREYAALIGTARP